MDLGFIILCPDRNPGGLKNSVGSINHHSYKRDMICVVGNDANETDLKVLKPYCQILKGDETLTSLVNKGMKANKHDWAFIMFSGSRIPTFLERKLENFAKTDRDVLYPVLDFQRTDFISGSFNGVMIHSKLFKEVGDFPTFQAQKDGLNDFELAKTFWAMDAIDAGAKFKGIVGMRII